MSVESYAHSAAKEVFAGWLREIAAEAWARDKKNPTVQLGDLWWRVNRAGPHYGVWLEYPIMRHPGGIEYDASNPGRTGLNPVWDEWDDKWKSRPPSYAELIASGERPDFIADLAIQHKGYIKTVVEVVHKNPPHDRKVEAYFRMGVNFLTLPSAWVLGQVARPKTIPAEFWMWEPA